jgi:hypothetical protein
MNCICVPEGHGQFFFWVLCVRLACLGYGVYGIGVITPAVCGASQKGTFAPCIFFGVLFSVRGWVVWYRGDSLIMLTHARDGGGFGVVIYFWFGK